jgi:hypothetical protein
MASDLRQRATEISVFHKSNLAKSRHGNDFLLDAFWPENLPAQAPWSKLSWGLFLPLVFAGNVVVAILAWIVVGWFIS